jgi:hypothetical protein
MQEEPSGRISSELLDRLRAMETPEASGSLAEAAYSRARDVLERALDEAQTLRLQAIDDARTTREREMTALMESMRTLRLAAQAQIETQLKTAEMEMSRLIEQSRSDAAAIVAKATEDALQIRAEAAASRSAADHRLQEIERLEADFDDVLERMTGRLGIRAPSGGWWRHLLRRK